MSINNVIPYPGGKKRIAQWIVNQIPPHHSYLEPFFGGGAVLFAKSPSPIETVNDLDGEVVNLYRVIRENTEELIRKVTFTPYAREEYGVRAKEDDPVERARIFLVKAMQSHGFRLNGDCGWKCDMHAREAAYALNHWNALPESISYIAKRLKSVQIECRPAVELINRFNNPRVFIYADPPYLLSTRNRKMYNHEMSNEDHIEFLKAVLQHTGPIMISGYDSDLYERYLKNWRKESIKNRTANASERIECLWMNYPVAEQLKLKLE